MKLTEGVYENIISESLEEDINKEETGGKLVSRKDNIDAAEAAGMFSEYIARLVKNRLNDDSLSTEEKAEFANSIIENIAPCEGAKIYDEKQILTAMLSRTKDAVHKATKTETVRPLSGFRVSNLFTGGQGPLSIGSEIVRDIASADRISLIVSFLKLAGVNLIYDALKKFCSVPGHSLRIITTTYCGITEAKAVKRLSELPNTEIRISYNTRIERLHAKAYIFERNSEMNTAYIGSSNLSKSAQTDGLEWNIRVTNVENPHIIKTALATFDIYWNSPNFEDFREGGLQRFCEQTGLARIGKPQAETLQAYTLLPHQKQILDHLEVVRKQGIRRNLIVAATGTGKTVISAFDYKAFANNNPGHCRLLFVAHREEILRQSLQTYRNVMVDANFGELWVGGEKPSDLYNPLFVSVQTFNANFDSFFSKLPADFYDYIVVDEVHHIAANSYRSIINHFNSPKLLVGLTATPERADQQSLLPDFDNTISAEIRLPQALNEGLLTPFQYLCISDTTDLTDDSLMLGNQYIPERMVPQLCRKERVDLIVDRLRYYLSDENKCKALCFCATKEHASFMADELRKAGLKAATLTSDNDEDRKTLRRKLERGEINYLCVVDMFNEGVDIPEVDTVLFLRPTNSLTVFLQQLGRGLRLSPGKNLLTVLDFVCQLNKRYDYASRFRSLLTRTDKPLKQQVAEGFTLLPQGCSIQMEEKTRKYVLQNISQAIYNKNRILRELSLASQDISLGDFLTGHDIEPELIYAQKRCWTSLKREAGLCKYNDDDITERLSRNGIGSLCHTGSLAYLNFIQKVMEKKGVLNPQELSDAEQTYALMLYYALFHETITKVGVSSIYEALGRLRNYPLFLTEISELCTYLKSHLSTNTVPVGENMPSTLELYGCYTREEVFIIMGRQTAEHAMLGARVSGVFAFDNLNTEAFFVTLNKSDKDFSPTTLYDDYVMGRTGFHWQSQNRDSHTGSGQRFVNQQQNGKRFLLFVREHKKDGYGNTCPFHCFGLVSYVRSYGDRPMNIEWRLHEPVMPLYLKSV